MSEATKTCNLSENEVTQLIIWHGYNLNDEGKAMVALEDMSERIERINYLNRRLKSFKEVEVTIGDKQGNSAEAVTTGWASSNG